MIDDLLVKYLVGESTTQEASVVEQWIAADDRNRKYFEQYKWVWEESRKLEPPGAPSETEAWEQFKQIRSRKENSRKEAPLRSMVPLWQRIAAVFLIIISGSLLYYFFHRPAGESGTLVTLASKDQVVRDTLSDGSIVTLNKKSSLSYPKIFSGNNRTVDLEGEAFFNVTPDKNKPFVIHSGGLDITVVGTSFNVKNNFDETSVIVETGIVEVARNKEVLRVNPKEMVIASGKNPKMIIEKTTDMLYNYYRSREFVCNSTPLWKLVDVLNEAYGAHIRIESENLKNLPLTTTFREESLENILNIITETFSIRMEKKNGEIILH